MELHQIREALDVCSNELSGFCFQDMNLPAATLTDVDLSGWSIEHTNLSGLIINSLQVAELPAANRAP